MNDKTDLITNWQFCDGSHFQGDVPELNVPDGWQIRYADNTPIPETDPPILGLRPECLPVAIWDVGGEGSKFGQSPPNPGQYNAVFKVHKWSAPFSFELAQEIADLTPGQRYLLRAWFLPDFYDGDGNPPNADAYAAAIGIGMDGEVAYHWPQEYGQWMEIEREFTAQAASVEISLAGLGKWGLPGNTVWLHGVRLYEVESDEPEDPDPGPSVDITLSVELGPKSRAFIEGQVDRIIASLDFSAGESETPEDSGSPWDDDLRTALPRNHNCQGLLADGWWRRRLDQIDALTLHHTAHENDDPAPLAQWYCFEKDPRGRPSIPYTLWIRRDGTVALCNHLEEGCWHDETGHENTHLSVAIVGDLRKREPTPAQYAAMVEVARWAMAHPEMQIERAGITGDMDWRSTECPGWLAGGWRDKFYALLDEQPRPDPETVTLLGLNDEEHAGSTGAQWLMAHKKPGLIVRPIYLGTYPQRLDFSAEATAGLRVIVNLRYSFARDNGGQGTLPMPGTPAWTLFIEAAGRTILSSSGVWGWTISNEANNPREHPETGALTPEIVALAYNEIRERVYQSTERPRMAPGALDPFNAQVGDPRDWLAIIWDRITGAEFVPAHGYVRGPDPELVGSEARFADAPLTWQYLNYPGCITALLSHLPTAHRSLPVYVTEFNHIWKDGGEGDWGWVDDERAGEIVDRAFEAASEHGFAGLALYRWAGDQWAVHSNEYVKSRLLVEAHG